MDEFILCLRWILYAKRPLRLQEFYFAMMAGLPTQGLEWILEDIAAEQMHSFLTTASKGFAECTEGKQPMVQFIHESVRNFLVQKNGLDVISSDIDPSAEYIAHERLKDCCIRGLAFDIPRWARNLSKSDRAPSEKQRRSLATRFPFAEYATTNILYHANRAAAGYSQQNFISRFERARWVSCFNAFQKHGIRMFSEDPSFSYVCAEGDLYRLVIRPCNALQPERQRYRSPLVAAIMTRSWSTARVFLDDMGANNIDQIIAEAIHPPSRYKSSSESLFDAPWRWAVRHGLEHLANFLLRSVPVTELTRADTGLYTLLPAVEGGSIAIVKHLLSIQPDLIHELGRWDGRSLAGRARSPLVLAALLGRNSIVETLLAKGADVNIQVESDYGTVLQVASLGGHGQMVRVLLANGADVNAQGGMYNSALQAASLEGHEKVVKTLLTNGADINAQGGKYGNALQAASSNGHIKVVETLLANGADVNAQEGMFGNALQAASMKGHTKVAETLLAKGADVNAQGGYCGNALQAASYNGHKMAVQTLLANGAYVNAQGGSWDNALQAATLGLQIEVAQMLLNAGASWDETPHG